MIRILDIMLAAGGLLIGSPIFLLLWLAGKVDTGFPLFRQARVGRHQQPFVLLKFRTMRPETTAMATHLVDSAMVTRWGRLIRRAKLDELPQLWNVLVGEMSMVGPRPCLLTQAEVIAEREARGVFHHQPGITGMAQLRGIDMSVPARLADADAEMMASMSVRMYLHYVLLTLSGRGSGDRVRK